MRGGVGVLALRMIGIGFALVSSVILARILGVEQYGVYSYVLATVTLLVVPAQFGLATLIVRETAQSEVLKNWSNMLGVWRWSTRIALSLSLLFAVLGGMVIYISNDHRQLTFFIGFILIPFIALNSLRSAALQGLRKVVLSQLPENLIRPALLIGFMLLAWFGLEKINANTAMILQVVSTAIAFIMGAIILNKLRPKETKKGISPQYKNKEWRKATLPMAFADGVSVVNTQADIIMLGMLTTSVQVGYYSIAAAASALLMVGVNTIATLTMPYFARYIADKNMRAFQKMAVMTARVGLILVVPAVFIFYFFGRELIELVYGQDFLLAYWPLIILTVANFSKAGFGMQGRLLNMSGHEKDNLTGAITVTIINVILNYVFIPIYGAVGAALATGLSIFFKNILFWLLVHYRLGVDSSFIGFFNNKEKLKRLSL